MRAVTGLLACLPLFLGACAADAEAADSPFAACTALPSTPTANSLPDLKLPCFTGQEQVSLRSLRGPAVVNIWASWCQPCRKELPIMQQLADTAGDRLTVLGVDTGDSREAGASFAADKSVTFPTLFDEDRKLVNAVGGINLPVTVFLDATGKTYVNLLPLDAAKLTAMIKEHTGVAVTL
ncbi:thiol-disulfide isomerase/thioredoxin [Actinoplanes tereljensis]|uniref:Alkyl hydroperoxide reductase n=1 Tax=Paractinoplanes tereljensis TaxID=571912 RepID=A0A919NU17_9ACTN|nr:TlpA disulfide reductase family protein [Actinoplanes tereljensis]GIF25246.1 alkyl hydroperoxide reductase [Actinoplanes tereljensis]